MPKKRNPYYKTSAITPIMRGGGDIWNRTNPWRNKGARTDNEMQGEKGSFMDKMTEGFGEVVGSALDSYGTGDKARAYFGNMYGEDTTSGNSKTSNAVGGFQQGFVKAGASSIGMGDMYQTKIDAGKHNAGAATYSNQEEISGNSALVGNVAGSAVMAYVTKGKGKKSNNTSPTENTSPTFDNSQSFSTSPSMTGMDSTLGYARIGGEVPKMGKGGPVQPITFTDPNNQEYLMRKKAYADSLNLHNKSVKLINQYKELGNERKKIISNWVTNRDNLTDEQKAKIAGETTDNYGKIKDILKKSYALQKTKRINQPIQKQMIVKTKDDFFSLHGEMPFYKKPVQEIILEKPKLKPIITLPKVESISQVKQEPTKPTVDYTDAKISKNYGKSWVSTSGVKADEVKGGNYYTVTTKDGKTITMTESEYKTQFRKREGGNPYSTVLTPEDSVKYNQWKNTIPKRLQYEGDYDLAGFWKKNPTWTPNTPGVHMTDQFKKPNHPTFSNESQYYNDSLKYKAGYWENDNYIPFKKADGGNVGNPNYEAENKEFVIGGNPNNYGGGRLKRYGTGLTKIEGATHEQGGVGMRGGDFVISAKQSFKVPESFLNDIKHLL